LGTTQQLQNTDIGGRGCLSKQLALIIITKTKLATYYVRDCLNFKKKNWTGISLLVG